MGSKEEHGDQCKNVSMGISWESEKREERKRKKCPSDKPKNLNASARRFVRKSKGRFTKDTNCQLHI